MSARWSFFAFDWARFRALEPALRLACDTGDFTSAAFEEAAELLETFDAEAAPEEVCNALLVELCGTGEAVVFETGLPELIHGIRRQPEGEEAADALGALVSAEPGIEDWFRVDDGLVGVLTEAQTQELAAYFAAFRRGYHPPESPRGLAAWARRLAPNEPAYALLDDLMDLIDETAVRRYGLGVLREE